MNEQSHKRERSDRDEKTMARLLCLAGERTEVPTDIQARVFERVEKEWLASSTPPHEAQVYKSVELEWRRTSSRFSGKRRLLAYALAASAVLAVGLIWQSMPPEPAIVPVVSRVGTVAKVVGGQSTGTLPAIGQDIFPGDRLNTGAGEGLSLRLSHGESFRLGDSTTVLVSDRNQFRLIRGRVYADTGEFIYKDRSLVIETDMGTVTDVGTQFAVVTADNQLDVAVREGRVDVGNGDSDLVTLAGERMQLTRGEQAVYSEVAAHDPMWSWATQLAPSFEIENKSLLNFLRWVARETGRELVFEDNELLMAAMRTSLHGSVSDLTPTEAIESVMTTTAFRYRIEADKITIERK